MKWSLLIILWVVWILISAFVYLGYERQNANIDEFYKQAMAQHTYLSPTDLPDESFDIVVMLWLLLGGFTFLILLFDTGLRLFGKEYSIIMEFIHNAN